MVTMPVGVALNMAWLVRSTVWPFTTPVTMYCWVCGAEVLVTVLDAVLGLRITELAAGCIDVPPVALVPPAPAVPPVGCAALGLNEQLGSVENATTAEAQTISRKSALEAAPFLEGSRTLLMLEANTTSRIGGLCNRPATVIEES